MHEGVSGTRQLSDPPYIAGMTKLTTYAEIDEVLRSKHFVQGSHQESQPFFGGSLLTIDGDEHFERRRMESTLFTREALAYYEHQALVPVIDRTMKEAEALRTDDGLIHADLVPLARTMLHRISAVATGIDDVDSPERTERFRWFVEKLGEAVTVEWSTRDHQEVIAEGLAIRNSFVEEFWRPSVERRRELITEFQAGARDAADLPRDLITTMYLHGEPSWDDELPLREATLYLVASTQTTTHAIPHAVVHLLEWFADHPEERAKANSKEFLRRAAQESLRLHLPAPSLLRFAVADVTLSSGRTIAAGERVACLFTPANRDTRVFGDDAERFNPYREVEGRAKPWGLAFGGGDHLCIGRPLVTGLTARAGEGSDGTEGTLVSILHRLFSAGVQLDPASPPVFTTASHLDAYASMPILLSRS